MIVTLIETCANADRKAVIKKERSEIIKQLKKDIILEREKGKSLRLKK